MDRSVRNRGKPGYPVPDVLRMEGESEKKGEDLGFGFNEEGYPLQDKYEFQDLSIAVENKKGSTRKWYDSDGKEKGSTKMYCDYGYVEGAIGVDDDEVDVYVGDDEDAEFAYVVHQNKAPDFEQYDEDKVMLGFPSEEAAKKAYLKQYADPKFYGGMSSMPMSKFKAKLNTRGKKITNEGIEPAKGLQLISQNRPRLEKRGVKVPQSPRSLGTGTNGTAFDLGQNTVLKVTSDTSEAQAALKLKGKSSKHIAKIFDVFRFMDSQAYGIVQEKLVPLSQADAKEFDAALVTSAVPISLKRKPKWEDAVEDVFDWWVPSVLQKKGVKIGDEGAKAFVSKVEAALDLLEKKYHLPEISRELTAAGIQFHDYQSQNMMMRGKDYVLIDTGLSKVVGGASEPDVLEQVLRETLQSLLEEGKVDSVAVVFGSFQPPSRGPLDAVRKLTGGFTKVVLVLDGKGGTREAPFSFEDRKRVIMMSMPDVATKLEVYAGTSADAPGSLDKIMNDQSSVVEADVALNVLVPPNDVEETKKQFAQAASRKEAGQLVLDPSLVQVAPISGFRDDSRQLLAALQKGDKEAVKKLVDTHLASNEEEFSRVYADLRDKMKDVVPVEEQLAEAESALATKPRQSPSLKSAGGVEGLKQVLIDNALLLKQKKNIDVSQLKFLGHGQMGVAYAVPDGNVLKITTDKQEARTSFVIQKKGQRLTNVVRIKDVFQFVGTDKYGIIQERLTPLDGAVQTDKGVSAKPGTEAAEFNRIAHQLTLDDAMLNTTAEEDYEDILFVVKTRIEQNYGQTDLTKPSLFKTTQKVTQKAGQPPAPAGSSNVPTVSRTVPRKMNALTPVQKKQKTAQQAKDEYEDFVAKMKKFNMDKIIPQLRSLGIKFVDFHAGNMMKRSDGEYVIADIGKSISNGPMPPVLEKIVRSVVDEVAGVIPGLGSSTCSVSGGSSGWSSHWNKTTDDDTEDEDPESRMWQKQLGKLQIGG